MSCPRIRIWCLSAFLIFVANSAATAKTITGVASVLDGDTIEIAGEQIRMHEIDAPDLRQTCLDHSRKIAWNCGNEAAVALQTFLNQYPVTCETRGTDYIGNWFAACEVPGMNIATWMAGQGWAITNQGCPCREVRAWAEFATKEALGIWNSDFDMPWLWREPARPDTSRVLLTGRTGADLSGERK